MRIPVSLLTLIPILWGCTYFFDLPSSLDAKEIHHLISNNTAIYLRIQNFKETQQHFLETSPVKAVQQSILFQQFQKSKEYENLKRGVEFARWLLETSPQEVFDNFFGQDVLLTLVPKNQEKGFYGLLLCELAEPEKSLNYIDIFYKYLLQKQGILREVRQAPNHPSQNMYYFQNPHHAKKEVFILTIVDRFLILSNDENLIFHAMQQLRQQVEPFFLQNTLVQNTLAQLPSNRFFTFYAHTEKIFSQFPQLFQKKPHLVPTKWTHLVENKTAQLIRDLKTVGLSISLEKHQLQIATTASFQNPKVYPAFPPEILSLTPLLSPNTFGVFNLRFFNRALDFVQENDVAQKYFQKLNALFEGKSFLTHILPTLGEEITFSLTELPSQTQNPSAPLKLPALNLFITGRPPENILKPILNALTTAFTFASFEKEQSFELKASFYKNIRIYSLHHPHFTLFGEQLLPSYTLLGNRLILSTSRIALQEIIDLSSLQKTISQEHPFFKHIFQAPSVEHTQNLFAPAPNSFFSIQLKKGVQFLRSNTQALLEDAKKENPQAEEQWAFLLEVLQTLENFTLYLEHQNGFSTLRLALKFD